MLHFFYKTAYYYSIALATISLLLATTVLLYLHDYSLEFNLDKHPFVSFCIICLLVLQPATYGFLAVLVKKLDTKEISS